MQRVINKILVIRFSSIGDIVLTTPVLRGLKQKYPDANLYFATKKEFCEITELMPYIDKAIFLDSTRKIKGVIKLIKEINSERFDLLVDLHWNFKSQLIYLLCPIKYKVHYLKHRLLRTLRILFKWKVLPPKSHIVDFYFEPLKKFGLFPDNRGLELKIVTDLKEHMLTVLPKAGIKDTDFFVSSIPSSTYYLLPKAGIKDTDFFVSSIPSSTYYLLPKAGIKDTDLVIGFSVGAKWATKRWPFQKFVEVGDRLIGELNASIILIGDRDDLIIGEKIEKAMGKKPLNLVGQTSILELVAIIQRCNLLVTNDSSPLHIGVALQVPTVSIFGPTTLDLGFGPYGNGHHIVLERTSLMCRPCSSHGGRKCPKGDHKCMELITSDEVVATIKNQLL